MLNVKTSVNTFKLNSLLNSSFHPLTPVFIGTWRGQYLTKWRGVSVELSYNTYLRNGWVVIDTGIKSESGTPIIEFSSWEPYVSDYAISLPNVLSYKIFFKKSFWRVGFLTRTSRIANEEWVTRLPQYFSFLNNTRHGASLFKNNSGTPTLSKPLSFLLSRFVILSAFNLERSYFKRNFERSGFDVLDTVRLDVGLDCGYSVVSRFCRDYLASFLRTKLMSYSKVIKRSYFLSYGLNFKYQSIPDILFRFNVIFTLFLSKTYLPSGKFFFERAFRELTNSLVSLMAIYRVRNFADVTTDHSLSIRLVFSKIDNFLRKVGVYFVFFSKLQVSKFFRCFFKFLFVATNRVFDSADGALRKLSISNSFSYTSQVCAYKFKQLWQLSNFSRAKTLIVDNYRIGFETFLKKFSSRTFTFRQNEQSEEKQIRVGRFKKYRPYKVKSYLRLQPAGFRTYPVRLRYKYKPRFPLQLKLFAFKKQFLFLYFWSVNFFSFFTVKNVNRKSFWIFARLKFFFKVFLKFLRFYAFTADYFKFSLSSRLRQKTITSSQFSSLRLYFWLLLKRSRKLMHAFGSLFSKIFSGYYRSVSDYLGFLISSRRSWFARLSHSAVLRIGTSSRTLPIFETRLEISALRTLFYRTHRKFNSFVDNANADVLRKMRGYLKFMLLLKRSTTKIFSAKLVDVLSTNFALPTLNLKSINTKDSLFSAEVLNALFTSLVKANVVKVLGFPKWAIERVLRGARRIFSILIPNATPSRRNLSSKSLSFRLYSVFNLFLNSLAASTFSRSRVFLLFTKVLKFLSSFYKKRQAKCAALLNKSRFSSRHLALNSRDLKALYLLKHRVSLNIGGDTKLSDLNFGGRAFTKQILFLRNFKYKASLLRTLFKSKLRRLSSKLFSFNDSSFSRHISALKVLLHVARIFSLRFALSSTPIIVDSLVGSHFSFLSNFRAKYTHELFCVLRILVNNIKSITPTITYSSAFAALLNNLWVNRLSLFAPVLPFLGNTFAFTYTADLSSTGHLAVLRQDNVVSNFYSSASVLTDAMRGIILSAYPHNSNTVAEAFDFINLFALALQDSTGHKIYYSIFNHFTSQVRFVRRFVMGFFYTISSGARNTLCAAFAAGLRAILYTLGLRWRTQHVLDSARVISRLADFASHLSFTSPFVLASPIRSVFLLKRRYTAVLFSGFAGGLARVRKLENFQSAPAAASLQVRINLLRGKLAPLTFYSATGINKLISTFLFKKRREIFKRIRFLKHKLSKSSSSKVIGANKTWNKRSSKANFRFKSSRQNKTSFTHNQLFSHNQSRIKNLLELKNKRFLIKRFFLLKRYPRLNRKFLLKRHRWLRRRVVVITKFLKSRKFFNKALPYSLELGKLRRYFSKHNGLALADLSDRTTSLARRYLLLRNYLKSYRDSVLRVRPLLNRKSYSLRGARFEQAFFFKSNFRNLLRHRYLLRAKSALKLRAKKRLARIRYIRTVSGKHLTPRGQRTLVLLEKRKGSSGMIYSSEGGKSRRSQNIYAFRHLSGLRKMVRKPVFFDFPHTRYLRNLQYKRKSLFKIPKLHYLHVRLHARYLLRLRRLSYLRRLGFLAHLFGTAAVYNRPLLSGLSLRGRLLRRTYVRRSERFKFFSCRSDYNNLFSRFVLSHACVDLNIKVAGILRPILRALVLTRVLRSERGSLKSVDAIWPNLSFKRLYLGEFLRTFLEVRSQSPLQLYKTADFWNVIQKDAFRRIRGLRKLRLRSYARKIGIFPKRNKRLKRMYWKLVNSGRMAPISPKKITPGLSIFDKRNKLSMGYSAGIKKRRFRFYTVKTQFPLKKGLWSTLVLLAFHITSRLRLLRTKRWRRRFYRAFRRGKWRLRKKAKARSVILMTKAAFFFTKLKALFPVTKILPLFLRAGSVRKNMFHFVDRWARDLNNHDSVSLYRAINLRCVHKFSARLTRYRAMLRAQFFRESKFSFIYKFIYSFVKKTNVLFNHFNILLRGAFDGKHFLFSLAGRALNGLTSLSYTQGQAEEQYFFNGGVLFPRGVLQLSTYSESRGVIVGTALSLFSKNYGYLQFSAPKFIELSAMFNNTSPFTVWHRSSFNNVYANWKRTLVITRAQISALYSRKIVSKNNSFYLLNSLAHRAHRRSIYKIRAGTRRWHTARKTALKQFTTKYVSVLQRANLKNRARSKSYARLLDLFRYHGKKTSIHLQRGFKRTGAANLSFRPKLPRRRYKRVLWRARLIENPWRS